MSYIKDTLLKEEQILHHARPHYIIFYSVFMWLILALFIINLTNNVLLGGIILFIGLISFINDLISYFCSEYVITNKRILMKVGFIRRKSLEIFLGRVEGIYIEQGIIGRILNFGTVIIVGVGSTKNPFYYIPDPLKFRSLVQQQMQTGSGKQ